MEITRRNRVRRIVSELNKQRRLQSRKIDILCNDFVSSHKSFLNQLQIMNLQIELYESIIGESSLEYVLEATIAKIERIVGHVNTAVWLGNGFATHVFDQQDVTDEQTDVIERSFNSELAQKIYNSHRCIELQELFEMGLPESETLLKLNAVAIPLQNLDRQGFILLYRPNCRPITTQEISTVATLVPGLSKAVKACLTTHQSAEK